MSKSSSKTRHGVHADDNEFLVVVVSKGFKKKLKKTAKKSRHRTLSKFVRFHLLEAANKSVNKSAKK